ncbi:uncharacterized protein LOC133824244 [Humulus lupulus]|uniref:uncharacterized protein LOC133824244 n=1 Tax=Humulus lupulus TaxID=3486 RepID=UPI002B40538A|nr:uncharacterized protein LOC133824244 [Humulus lupulus]
MAHVCDNGKCLCFSITLAGLGEEWWKRLKQGSIQSWFGLQSVFHKKFVATMKMDMQMSALANVKQHPTETLRAYIQRFTKEASKTKVDDRQLLGARSPLWDDIAIRIRWDPWDGIHVPDGLWAHFNRVRYRVAPTGYSATPSGAQTPQTEGAEASVNHSRGKRSGKGQNRSKPSNLVDEPQYTEYTNLVDTLENIYLATGNVVHYWKPAPVFKGRKNSRDTNKRCAYHKDVGHTTKECHQLKDVIKNLIKLGHLHQWVKMPIGILGLPANPRQPTAPGAPRSYQPPQGGYATGLGAQAPQGALMVQAPGPEMPYPPETAPLQVDGHIATISGGPHLGGPSQNDQKRYLSKLDHNHEVCALIQTLAQHPKLINLLITFTEEDARNVHFSHHDPLVIDAQITNERVSRVLVDDRSSVNVLFKLTFTIIGLTEADLASCPTQIYDFNWGFISSNG